MGAGGGGVDWNPINSSIGTNLNMAHNNQNMVMNPAVWNTDIGKSSMNTGAGTPWGAGGMYEQMGDTSQLTPGMGLEQPKRTNPNDHRTNTPTTTPTVTPSFSFGNNGAQPSYMNNTSEQNFLNSYAKSLNPNVNYNINAQTSPFTNAAVRGNTPTSTGGK